METAQFTEKQKEYLSVVKDLPVEFGPKDIRSLAEARGINFTPSGWYALRNILLDMGALSDAEGSAFLKKNDKFMEIIKKAKPNKIKTKKETSVQTPPPDISPTANALADNISALIAENDSLRNSLRQINQLTAKLLNIQE